MEKIKRCWCWISGAGTMALIISLVANFAIYNGKLSRQSPEDTCGQLYDAIYAEHQMAKTAESPAKPVQLKRGK